MITFRTWCQRLHALYTASGAPFPVNNGDYSSVREHGLCYHLIPLRRRSVPSPWFDTVLFAQRERFTAEAQGHQAPSWARINPLLLVHWPNFLWAARFGSGSPVQPLAHELLRHLLPLVYQFDPALACLIRTFEVYFAAKAAKEETSPLFFGQRDQEDEDIFNQHLHRLLSNKMFRRCLGATMVDTFTSHIVAGVQNTIGLCSTGDRHFRGQSCEHCKSLRWQRRYVTVLWPNSLTDFQGPLRIQAPSHYDVDKVSPWTEELRYWLSVDNAAEGIVRVGGGVLVDFVKVRELAEKWQRPSPLLDESAYPWPNDAWLQGYHTRVAVEQRYKDLLERSRPQPLATLVSSVGWYWAEDTLDIPYELYSVDGLLHRLSLGKKSRDALAMVRKKNVPRHYARRVAYLNYVDPEGMSHDIHVHQRIRHKRLVNYYTVPYHVVATDRERGGLAVKIGTQLFWSFYAVNQHATPVAGDHIRLPKTFRGQVTLALPYVHEDSELKPRHPEAVHFAQFLARIDPTLDKDKFEQMIYDSQYNQRLLALQRGERKHIGSFTALEDGILSDFFSRRITRHKLTDVEWSHLLAQLPGRSKVGVQRRLEDLSFKYAMENGYQAYRSSGWCLRHSEKRKKRWLSMGVRVE